jgi:ABC-type branched-subunit amino acid transport system substrate-binding protein
MRTTSEGRVHVRTRIKAVAGATVLALALAACGGGDDTSATGNVLDKTVGSALGGQQVGGTGTTGGAEAPQPTSMDDWEKLWAKQRAEIVQEIKQNGWGMQADGKTVLGPEGFKIDLSACGQGWSNTEGLTDTEIKFGATGPASGVAADAVNINRGEEVIFDYYGGKGAFTDSQGKKRSINYILKDDGYDPTRTIPLVDELIDSEHVFMLQNEGSANVLRVYDKLNQRCIPQLFDIGGHPGWGDPVNHPWTTGHQISYNVEALLLGSFIDQHIDEFGDGPVTVGAVAFTNDFGKVYDQALREYLAQSPNKDRIQYQVEWVEPQVTSLTDPMTTLAAKKPDVFIAMMTGTPCSYAITEAAQNGMKESTKYKFLSSVCNTSAYVGQKAVGDASNGWWTMGGGYRDIASPGEDGNAWVQWGRQLLQSKGYDYKASGYLGWGLVKGWGLTQILQVAGQLDGGLTRANLITAARTMDMTNPGLSAGMGWNTRGNADAYFIEGSQVAEYDSSQQRWVQQGAVVDLSGRSKPCAWDQSTSSCR